MCTALSADVVLPCNGAVGGVYELLVSEASSVTTITVVAGAVTVVTNAAGKKFRHYELSRATAEAISEMITTQETGATSCNETISFVINTLSAAVATELTALMKARARAVVVDRTGAGWMYGLKNGVTGKSMKAGTGKAANDRNGYDLVLEGNENELPPYVSPAVIATLTVVGS